MEQRVAEAGAVVFKPDIQGPKVVIIRSRKNPGHWIFPKGHIDPGENASQAAMRELSEEAGIKGTPLCVAGVLSFTLNAVVYDVEYWLARYAGIDDEGESGRDPRWCSVHEALALLSFPDTKELLVTAERMFASFT